MSIEFGIPILGSTLTLDGSYRVSIDESVFLELQPMLARTAYAVDQELDMYGSAMFEGDGLRSLIAAVSGWHPSNAAVLEAATFKTELLRIARHAEASAQPLLYLGL
jgi:hypothetical protein